MSRSYSTSKKDKRQQEYEDSAYEMGLCTADTSSDRGEKLDFDVFNCEGTFFRMCEAKNGNEPLTKRERDVIAKYPGICRVVRSIDDMIAVAMERNKK